MIGYKFIVIFLTLLFSGLAAGAHPAPAQAQSAADPRFGAIESFWASEEAAELGVAWDRVLFYWEQIQPWGPNDWNTLHVREEWLIEAQAEGRSIVGLLKNTPAWATDGPPSSGVPRGLHLPADDPDNLWANYVRRVVRYYAPFGVRHWIVWNEPEIPFGVYGHEFTGSLEEYYRLLKVAYIVIKETDPSATVSLAGWSYWHDEHFLRRFLQVATSDPEGPANNYFFDVIPLHIYFRVETIPFIVSQVWAVQNEFGLSKPIWINETNASPNLDPDWPVIRPRFQVDLDQQAWFLIQAHALGFSSGVSRIAVYKLLDVNMNPGDESFGILRPDHSKRPAFYAYQTTIRYLGGFTQQPARERYETHYVVSFPRDQAMTRLLWTRTARPVTVNLPALTDEALLINATGSEKRRLTPVDGYYSIALEGARCQVECEVGGPPVFLVEGERLPDDALLEPAELEQIAAAPADEAQTTAPSPTPFPTAPPAAPLPLPTVTPTPAPAGLAAAEASPPAVPTTASPPEPAVSEPAGFSVYEQIGLWFLAAALALAALLLVALLRRPKEAP